MNSSHPPTPSLWLPGRIVALLGLGALLFTATAVRAASEDPASGVWITSWAASPQGPYPSGAAVAQPDLSFAFPTGSANDQTFRLIVRPDLWSSQMRVRFTNLVGNQPVTFDGIFVGLQKTGATIEPGTSQPITFSGNSSLTLRPGQTQWSDPVSLPFVHDSEEAGAYLPGRKLAISFHTVGQTGPMTWHAKAMTTSYVTNPGAGSVGQIEDDAAFPTST